MDFCKSWQRPGGSESEVGLCRIYTRETRFPKQSPVLSAGPLVIASHSKHVIAAGGQADLNQEKMTAQKGLVLSRTNRT